MSEHHSYADTTQQSIDAGKYEALRRSHAELLRIVTMCASHTSRTEKNIKTEANIALANAKALEGEI